MVSDKLQSKKLPELARSRWLMQSIMGLVYPSLCLLCKGPLSDAAAICAPCWQRIHFTTDAVCQSCGIPVAEFAANTPILCARCFEAPMRFESGKAALLYHDMGRKFILQLKRSDRSALLPLALSWMQRAGAELIEKADILLPVPQHWRRRLELPNHLPALLATHIGHNSMRPVSRALLYQRYHTHNMHDLDRQQREEQVADKYGISRRGALLLHGQRVLLIDDVLTTGATLNSCAEAVYSAGARRVDVLVLGITPLRRGAAGNSIKPP